MGTSMGELKQRIRALIERLSDGSHDDDARDALLLEVAREQSKLVAPYARWLGSPKVDCLRVAHIHELPALPADVFRFARVASYPADEDIRVFRTSATTSADRGEHPFRDLLL